MTASGAPARTEYDALAPYYDAFTAAWDYEAWASEGFALHRLLRLLESLSLRP